MTKFNIGEQVKLNTPHGYLRRGKIATIVERPPLVAVHVEGKPDEDWFIVELNDGTRRIEPARYLQKLNP